jgi:hypothetical protein
LSRRQSWTSCGDGQGVLVAAAVEGVAAALLGRHVGRGTGDARLVGGWAGLEGDGLGEAEVGDERPIGVARSSRMMGAGAYGGSVTQELPGHYNLLKVPNVTSTHAQLGSCSEFESCKLRHTYLVKLFIKHPAPRCEDPPNVACLRLPAIPDATFSGSERDPACA